MNAITLCNRTRETHLSLGNRECKSEKLKHCVAQTILKQQYNVDSAKF